MEAIGDKGVVSDFLMTARFSRINSKISARHSRSGKCWKSSSRGYEVRGDLEMQGKSNAKESTTRSERLGSYLVLW